MHRSIFKSFRFEIVLYSLYSLIFALLTEGVIYGIGWLILKALHSENYIQKADMGISQNAVNSLSNSGSIYFKPVEKIEEPITPDRSSMIYLIIIAVIAGMILFVVYFLLLTKRFGRYLDEITAGIGRLSEGHFETRIAVRNDNELTDIAIHLNKMADDVRKLFESERKTETAKNDLITNVAHDLRTPLTSILGYLDLVASQKLNDETRNKYIGIAYNKSKRLETLIDDLFTYTKLDFGEMRLNLTDMDLVKMMEQMYEEFYPSFQDSNMACDFICGEKEIILNADGGLLARAFANLISNAIKYGVDGKNIKILVSRRENIAQVSITNYGELIPEEALDNIFDRFYRVENSRSTETGGSGLGLTIAKNIIRMHGGAVSVRSDFNGTVFEVLLPV